MHRTDRPFVVLHLKDGDEVDRSKTAKQARRMAILGGLLGGLVFMAMSHLLMKDGVTQQPIHSIFGNPSHWPAFFRSFLPLDFLATSGYTGILMYILLQGMPDGESIKTYVKMFLGFCTVAGCFGGLMMAAMYGWVLSLQGFIFLFVGGGALMLGLGSMLGSVFGLGWCIRWTWIALWPHWRNRLPGRMLTKFGLYIEGGPDPDEPSESME